MTASPLRLTFADPSDRSRLVVEWILSSVCNYNCSYCPVYLHDGRVRWPDYDDIAGFCGVVRRHYPDRSVTFLLSGGEISLYPHLIRLAEELRAMSMDVAILNNGSRPLAWWRQHGPRFDEVLLSYHHESADPDHFAQVVCLLETLTRIQVNVVIDPAAFSETMLMADRIEEVSRASVHRKIMFLDGWRRQAEYTPEQQQRLTEALAGEAMRSASTGAQTLLKGDLDIEFDDGSRRRLTPLQIIDAGLNRWRDWTCAVGEETLFIRFDEVWRAACREGGRVGSIFDSRLRLPEFGVRCTASACNCIAGIKATKLNPLGTGQETHTV